MVVLQEVTQRVVLPHETLSILETVSLTIQAQETVAIIGPSGSGKTTLLGLMAGLDVPSSGRIWLAGQDITALDENARARHRGQVAGFVFQSFHLLPGLTALENVMLPLELRGHRDARQQAATMLERVGLKDRARHYPRQLSGGEQQRVALARAFVVRPKILFADEPTGSLDAGTGAQITELLLELNRDHGATLVLVTHESALAARCGRRLRMEAGRLLAEVA